MDSNEFRKDAVNVLAKILRGEWPSEDEMRMIGAMKDYWSTSGPKVLATLTAFYANQANVKGE